MNLELDIANTNNELDPFNINLTSLTLDNYFFNDIKINLKFSNRGITWKWLF
jgi:hypothetical protein